MLSNISPDSFLLSAHPTVSVKSGFCYACQPPDAPERLPETNDLRDDAMSPGQIAYAVCHGCGWGLFNREGRRVELVLTCVQCGGDVRDTQQAHPVCATCGGMMISTLPPEH